MEAQGEYGMAVDTKPQKGRSAGATAELVSPFVDRVLVPGDQALDLRQVVAAAEASGQGRASVLRVGSGLRQEASHVVATKAGILRSKNQKKFWIESSSKRYTPAVEEEVLGIVIDKHAENLDIDIRGPSLALLPILAFEGATRRNRPNLEIGGAVYARVVKTHPDAVPELSCVDASGRSAGFGPLLGGFIFECSTGLARSLMSTPRPGVLEALGSSFSFELAVGLNGRVWVKGESVQATILVSNAIQASEGKSSAQQRILVRALLQASRSRD